MQKKNYVQEILDIIRSGLVTTPAVYKGHAVQDAANTFARPASQEKRCLG